MPKISLEKLAALNYAGIDTKPVEYNGSVGKKGKCFRASVNSICTTWTAE